MHQSFTTVCVLALCSKWFLTEAKCTLKPGQSDFFAKGCGRNDSAFRCCGFDCRDNDSGCSSFCCWKWRAPTPPPAPPPPVPPAPAPPAPANSPAAAAVAAAGGGSSAGLIIIVATGVIFACCCCLCCLCCICRSLGKREALAGDKVSDVSDMELPAGARCPSHWVNQDLANAFDERYEQEDLIPIVQKMFDTTWKDIVTRDRQGDKPDRLEVVSVQRFEDSQLWNAYLQQQEKIKQRGPLKSVLELDGDFAKGHVMTEGFVPYLTNGQQLDQSLNEHYLFHGTSPDAAEHIAESGFRINLAGSNAGTMFGKGAYFAECVSKADEYAAAGAGVGHRFGLRGFSQKKDEFAILVCRVTCGNMFRALRGSDKKEIIPLVQEQTIDGVLGDREASVGTYREFVVFKEAQIYPEYRVLYRRKNNSEVSV